MIVCSCNVFSDNEIRRALASGVRPPRVTQVYASLGYARQCGRCARTIRKIMHEAGRSGGGVGAVAVGTFRCPARSRAF